MNQLPTIEGLTNIDIKLLNDLDDFNKKYAKYVRCNDSVINPNNKTLKCSAYDMSLNTVKNAYNKLTDASNGDFTLLRKSIGEPSFQYFYEKEIREKRMDLDKQIKQYTEMNRDNQMYLDNTIYIYLLWTTVFTCGIYFAFSKL